jgi:hypothetical protein
VVIVVDLRLVEEVRTRPRGNSLSRGLVGRVPDSPIPHVYLDGLRDDDLLLLLPDLPVGGRQGTYGRS